MKFTQSDIDRFNAKIDKSGDCWLWTGGVKSKEHPYGKFSMGKCSVKAHRAAWLIANGPIAEGLHVLHRCDNPRCVRPEHLFLGTHQQNMADMHAKGRHTCMKGERWYASHPTESFPRGDDNWARRHPERVKRGEQTPWAKLSDRAVAEIRAAWLSTEKKYGLRKRLAEEYGVTKYTIWHVVTNRTWTHV